MKNLYVKDSNDNYIPVRLELISPDDLANKLILITVGNEEYKTSDESIQYIREAFVKSEVITDAMRRSINADLLIIPHIIQLELLAKKELEEKVVSIQIDNLDDVDNLPELKAQIKDKIGKNTVFLPSPITIKEYKEIKAIKERASLRKQRHGGGVDKIND